MKTGWRLTLSLEVASLHSKRHMTNDLTRNDALSRSCEVCSRIHTSFELQEQWGRLPFLEMNASRSLLMSVYQKVAPPSRDEVLDMIQRKIRLRQGELRSGWMVKAAAWVKKRHVDRGDRKVGILTGPRRFQVIKVSDGRSDAMLLFSFSQHIHAHVKPGLATTIHGS